MTSTTLSFIGDLDVRRALESSSAHRIEAIRRALAGSDEVIASLASVFPDDDSVSQPELTDDQVIKVVTSLGVTVALMGNQATMQVGATRMMSLIRSLRAAGVAVVGTGEDEAEARVPHRISLSDDKASPNVYILAASSRSPDDFRGDDPKSPEGPGVASTRIESVSGSIEAIRREDPGAIVVVVPDWSGLERRGIARKTQRWSLAVIDSGADYVLGHGSSRTQRARLHGTGATLHSLGQVLPGPEDNPGQTARFRWLPTRQGGEGFLSVFPLPATADIGGNVRPAVRRLLRRKISDLLALKHMGHVEYHGDTTCIFNGLEYRHSPSRLAGKFYVIMGSGWPRATRRRSDQLEVPLADIIERGKRIGVKGFVIGREDYTPELLTDENVIVVDETRDYLIRAAAALRCRMAGKLVAITGTAGKSSTQGMVRHLLEQIMPGADLLCPAGNQNLYHNTLVFLTQVYGHDVAVLETSASPAYRPLDFRVSPDMAVITNIGESHLELFGTVENVAKIKSTLFERLPKGGTALMSADIAYREIMEKALEPQGITAVTYGESGDADIRLVEFDATANTMRVSFRGRATMVNTGGLGIHMLHNSLAALGVVDALGHDWVEAAQHIASFQPIAGRGRVQEVEGKRSFTLIDESFNANPSSMRASLAALLQRPGRRIAVLGDMLEMGEQSAELHSSLIEHVSTLSLAKVYLVGPIMAGYAERLPARLVAGVFQDTETLAARLLEDVENGDVVMLKASHGIGLGRVVSELTASN